MGKNYVQHSMLTKFLILMAIGTTIAACQPINRWTAPSPAPIAIGCRTIPHEGGETKVCGQPQRIVVLGPYVLESLLALGIQPVAFAEHISLHQGGYDHPSQQIPYLGDRITQPLVNAGTSYNPAIEAILNAKEQGFNKIRNYNICGTAV
jgi:iron complex transport system substrate-binding protein